MTVLLISGFADGTGDHEQPRSQVREAVPRFGKPGAASQAVSTSRLESGLGNTGSALLQQDARRQSKDFPARATVRTGLVNADGLVEIMFVAAQ